MKRAPRAIQTENPSRNAEGEDRGVALMLAYQRGDDIWPVMNISEFIESNLFLQAAAEG